ncbi:MAG: MMPL family transporter [candidate division Zixibacteria bacterium]|nr:MMPL family transporter [candidate division Zixibacteria bacterium]
MTQGKHAMVNFAVNHPKVIVAVSIIITLGLMIPIPFAQIDTDPENMLEQNERVRVIHDQIKEEFSLYDHLVVGFVDEEKPLTQEFIDKLGLLVEEIEEMEGVVAEDVMAPSTVDDIYRTPDDILVVDRLTADRQGYETDVPVAEKIADNPILQGKLGSADGHVIAVYVPLEKKTYAHDVAESVRDEISTLGITANVHIAGLPVAEETFGKEMFKQMGISAPLAGLLIFLLMLVFFKRFSVVTAPMIIAVMTVVWTMGLLVLFGFTVHIMSSMIPIFLMPIAVLDSIHVLSEFHDRYQKSKSQRVAILSTIDELFKPMLFTTVTTIVGFSSLMLAAIPPVRVFGAFVAIGVLIAWLLSVTFNPAYAVLLPKRVLTNFGRQDEGRSLLGRLLPRAGRFAARARVPVLIFTLVLFAIAAFGITKIQVNDNPTKWFKESHPIRIADNVLGSHLAGTYMAYLEFDATDTETKSVKNPETLRLMDGLQDHLAMLPQVGSTTGITDIVKKVRFELKDGDSAAAIIPDSPEEIAQELFLYETSGGDPDDLFKFITPDGGKAVLWLQMNDGDNRAVDEVVQTANTYLEQNNDISNLGFEWGGLTYINVVWQEKMVVGMLEALLGSFIIVTIMMTLLLRSFSLGIMSMVPLTLTIAVVYGAVGLIGKPYDMPIAVLSALTLGLSIDFAIHFLKRGQEIYKKRKSLPETMNELFDEPARAITRNIVVIALGFVPLLFSVLVPYITVGSFFLAIMALSGFATLIILPALVNLRGERAFRMWGVKYAHPHKTTSQTESEKEMVS